MKVASRQRNRRNLKLSRKRRDVTRQAKARKRRMRKTRIRGK
jgi:hypothetical protein